MAQITFKEFKSAVDTLGILSLTNKKDIRKKYLKLSLLYHPDMENGSEKRFQEINMAYKIVNNYIDNFRFMLDEDEFKKQNPILPSDFNKEWIKE